jgi:xanthine dehydrogenase large subunit
MPQDLEVRYLENAGNPLGPFHSKAVGEPPLMYGIGVFFALRDALKAVRPDKELAFAAPLTPERVLLELWGDDFRFEQPEAEPAAPAEVAAVAD